MGRLKALGVVLTILAFVIWSAPPSQGAEPQYGGTLIYAAGADPDSLDPPNTQSNPGEAMNRMIYENLVRFDEKLRLVPGLATKWDLSKDGKTWTFYLRKGVKFHDGTPFNAEAVRLYFERVLGPEKPLKAPLFTPFVDRVEVVDDYTIKVHLKTPFAFFLNHIAHSAGGIASPAALKKWGKDITLHPVGTGPFKFVEWIPGDHLTLERNEDYWAGRPYLDRIIVRTVKEDSARVLMLEAGDAHVIVRIPPEDIPRLAQGGKVKLDMGQTNRALYVGLNNLKKPFDDVRVRQALNYAIDKEGIVKNIYQGMAMVIPGPVGPLSTGYYPAKGYPYDPAKAKKLLAEAGYPNGFKASMWTPKGRYLKDFELMQAIQQQLKEVGVETTFESMEWAAYLAITRKPPAEARQEIFLMGWSPSTAEARWGLYPLFHSEQWAPKGDNRWFYTNKKFDEAIEKATVAVDIKTRDRYLKEAQEIVIKDAPVIFLLATKEAVGMSKKVHGVINLPLELVYVDHRTWLEK